jgi:hypothetical protein
MRLLLASLLISIPLAHGDSWAPPVTQIHHSRDASIVVRIDPVQRDQKDARPTAIITKWSPKDRSYRFLRRVTLRNPRSPIIALITNDARFLVTFDDWFGVGTTENAVVIYDLDKDSVRNYRIEDFLPESYRERFRRSTSSITWRGEPFVVEWEPVHIYVPLPDTTPDGKGFDSHIEIDPAKNKIWIQKDEKP